MANLEKTLLFLTLYLFAASSVAWVLGLVFGSSRWQRWGRLLIWTGLGACTATIAARWQAVGHGPYISRYEVFLSNVWVAAVVYLGVSRIWPGLRALGALVVPALFLGLGAVAMAPAEVVYLSPSHRSAWLIIHILFAKLASGAILVATALALVFLFKNGKVRAPSSFWDRFPESERCDILSYKMLVCAFVFATVMIISGSIWGNQLWGTYWGWDPLETWSLILWLIYGLYLHLRITFQFTGAKSSWFIIGAFIATIFSFFVLPYVVDTAHNAYLVN